MSQELYILRSDKGLRKIGISSNAQKRARNISLSAGVVVVPEVTFAVTNARMVERMVHMRLGMFRQEGEWFDVSLEYACSVVEAVVDTIHSPAERNAIMPSSGMRESTALLPPISAAQCRAARGLINISRDQLEFFSGVSRRVLSDFEHELRLVRQSTNSAIRRALEEKGVSFTETGVEERSAAACPLHASGWG